MATAGKANAKEGPKEINFSWEGKNKAGKVVRGDIRAASESVANAALRRQGINVTKLKKQKGASGKVSEKDITLFSRQLATMVKSGVPLLSSFDIVGKGASNPALAKLLFDIKADVETGSNLATAFRKSWAEINGQTWRLRSAAMALLVLGGATVSASTASAVAPSKSPFAAWSSLAPSTLLEPSE